MDKYGEARARLLDDRMKVIQAENLRLQKRVEELEMNIKEAVKEIEEEDIYGQLTWNAIKPILRKHGLMEDK